MPSFLKGCHVTQHNDTRHNDTQRTGLVCDTKHELQKHNYKRHNDIQHNDTQDKGLVS